MIGLNIFYSFILLNGAIGVTQFSFGCALYVLYYKPFASNELLSSFCSLAVGLVGFVVAFVGFRIAVGKSVERRNKFKSYSLYVIGPLILHFITALIASLPAFNEASKEYKALPAHKPTSQVHRINDERQSYLNILMSVVTLSCIGMLLHLLLAIYSCCYANSAECMDFESDIRDEHWYGERGMINSTRSLHHRH